MTQTQRLTMLQLQTNREKTRVGLDFIHQSGINMALKCTVAIQPDYWYDSLT